MGVQQALLTGSVNKGTGVGSKLAVKPIFDVLTNKNARRGIQRSGSIPERLDGS